MQNTQFEIDDISCYMNKEEANKHLYEIRKIVFEIQRQLMGTGFDHLDFHADPDSGIQVRLYHKSLYGFSFGKSFIINSGWTNVDEVIENSIQEFIKNDTEENLKGYKDYVTEGLLYGWD